MKEISSFQIAVRDRVLGVPVLETEVVPRATCAGFLRREEEENGAKI